MESIGVLRATSLHLVKERSPCLMLLMYLRSCLIGLWLFTYLLSLHLLPLRCRGGCKHCAKHWHKHYVLNISRTQRFWSCDQLFLLLIQLVARHCLNSGSPFWIVETIPLANNSKGLRLPESVHAHSTRGMAASWALFRGVSVEKVCSGCPRLGCPLVRFYRLDMVTPPESSLVLSTETVGC